MMKRRCITLISFLFIISAQAQTTTDHSDFKKQIDAYFEKEFTSNSGGASVAVVKQGEIVFKNAYGMANLEYEIPNTVNTVFHAASLSKQFTAYAILLLEQEGKLSLDDDIRSYIPEVPDFGEKITLHHLASHTSGLRDQWRLLFLAGWRPDDVIRTEDILQLVSKQTDINFDPGSKLMYSNTGYTLLAEVVARVSGKTFSEFTQERIFKPLDMSNTQFYDDHNKIVKNRAYSYENDDTTIKKDKLNFSTVGATSLFTNVMDLCKWAIHLNTLHETNEELSKRMNTQARLNNGELTEAAMGQWTGPKFRGMEWFDHSGSDASFRAYFSRFPESNSAVMLLGNKTPLNAQGLALGVADPFLKEFNKKEQDKLQKNEQSKKTYDFIKLPKKQLSKFIGTYWEPEEWYDREIKIVNDTLIYYRSESSQTKLLPVSKNEFKMLGDSEDVSVFFEKNQQNEAVIRLNINDKRTVNFVKYDENFLLDSYQSMYYSPEVDNEIRTYIENGNLFLSVFKQKPVQLISIKKDVFTSGDRNFKKVEFMRNSKNDISGILISNGGVIEIKYHKK